MNQTIETKLPHQPVPNLWDIELDPVNSVCRLVAHSIDFTASFFFDAEGLEKFAEALVSAAKQLKTGLIVPNSGLIAP